MAAYGEVVAPVLINALAVSGVTAIAGCSVTANQSITGPDGTTVQATRILQTSAVNVFADIALAQTLGGKGGLELDLFVNAWPGYSSAGSIGADGIGGLMQLRDETSPGQPHVFALANGFNLVPGWNRVRMSRKDFDSVAAGAPVYGTSVFGTFRLKLNNLASHTHDVYVRNLSYSGFGRPQCCFVFDDIGSTVYSTAFPLMAARGIPGCNAVISDAIGQSAWNGYDRCSLAQLLEMTAAGWDNANHTRTHGTAPFLLSSTAAQVAAEYSYCRGVLEDAGLSVNGSAKHACSPYGEHSPNIKQGLQDAGMLFTRGSIGTAGYPQLAGGSNEVIGRYLRPCYSVVRTSTATEVKNAMDYAAARGGNLLILHHHIVTTPNVATTIETSTANFTDVIDYAHRMRGIMDFVNLSTFFGRLQMAGLASAY